MASGRCHGRQCGTEVAGRPAQVIVPVLGQRIQEHDGGAELLGVRYEWEATTVRYGSPARRFDPDVADFRDYPKRFRLYDVRLKLARAGQEREFLYQELAWEPVRW